MSLTNKYEALVKRLVMVDPNTKDWGCCLRFDVYEEESVWYFEFRTDSEDWSWFEFKVIKRDGGPKVYINNVPEESFTTPQIKELCALIEEKHKERETYKKRQVWGSIGVIDM